MAVYDRDDFYASEERTVTETKTPSPSVIGIILIGMICGTIAAVIAFVSGASLGGLLLAYGIGGTVSLLPVVAVVLSRRPVQRDNRPDEQQAGEKTTLRAATDPS